jgi:hypothetical protein
MKTKRLNKRGRRKTRKSYKKKFFSRKKRGGGGPNSQKSPPKSSPKSPKRDRSPPKAAHLRRPGLQLTVETEHVADGDIASEVVRAYLPGLPQDKPGAKHGEGAAAREAWRIAMDMEALRAEAKRQGVSSSKLWKTADLRSPSKDKKKGNDKKS